VPTRGWLKYHRAVPLSNPQGIPVDVTGMPKGYLDWAAKISIAKKESDLRLIVFN
jgi:hypothetical protein